MASRSYLSVSNYAALAAAITASTAASGHPVSNVSEPERLGLTWRSTSTGDQTIVIDMGSAVQFDRLALLGVNVTSLSLQNNTADSWAPPAYDSGALTVGIDPDRLRYRRWVAAPTNFTRRYTRIVIPTQATTDGAAYFEIAGLWMGRFLPLPVSPHPGYTRGLVTPSLRDDADLGRWSVEYETGDAFATQRWDRFAGKNPLTPGIGDQWATWLDHDREIARAPGRRFCWIVEHWGTGAVWVMRQTSPNAWQDDQLSVARDVWELSEAVAG